MRLSVPAAAVIALAVVLTAGRTDAKMPDPRFSTTPTVIAGSPSGAVLPSCGAQGWATPERLSSFRVVLRDVSDAPLAYVSVRLDLGPTACRLYADDRPGTTVDCAARTITRLSGLDGIVEFAPRFSGGCPDALVEVTADGFPLGSIPARSTDIDLDGRTGLGDLWHVADNYLHGEIDTATDFDPCAGEPGRTTLADILVFSRVMLGGGSGTVCP